MTREEAITELSVIYERLSHPENCENGVYAFRDGDYLEALDMAIEALSQPIVAKHFDIQKGYIYCSPQIAENVKIVVRCKDCKHRFVDGENVKYNCCELNHNKHMANEWHCADGERREP